MNPPHRVALLSANWTVWEHRLLSGALRYADAHPRIVVRVFAPLQNVAQATAQALDWGAEGAFGFLEHGDLQEMRDAMSVRPVPLVNCALAAEGPGVVSVLGDFSAFVDLAVGHLRQMGLRSLALLVLEEGPQVRDRLVHPFLACVKPKSAADSYLILEADRQLLWEPETKVAPVPKKLEGWLRDLPKPVGILCPHLGGGGYLIRCCRELGLRVPEEVAVVGSDDTDLSLACQPTLTSVLLSVETLGFEALRILVGLIKREPEPSGQVRLKTMALHVRESTGSRRPEICNLSAALECIQTNATQGISVEEVIRRTQHVSKVTFHKHFREAIGKSPAEAIRDRKLEEARRLLSGTELPLEAVSELCGFSSARVMSRVFASVEGRAPRDYRRACQRR